MRTNPDKITLGSGKAYIAEYNTETGMPSETDTLCLLMRGFSSNR